MADDDLGADIGDDGENTNDETATAEGMPEKPEKAGDGLKADVARERKRRQAAEQELTELREYRKKIDAANGKDDAKTTAPEDDERAQWESVAVRQTVRAELRDAGFTGDKKALTRVLRMVDVNELEFDVETGDVDGLADQIEEIKKDFPSLFAKAPDADDDPKRRTAPRVTREGRDVGAKRPSTAEQIAQALMG